MPNPEYADVTVTSSPTTKELTVTLPFENRLALSNSYRRAREPVAESVTPPGTVAASDHPGEAPTAGQPAAAA